MTRIPFSFLVLALASSLVACSSVVVDDDPDTFSGTVTDRWDEPLSGVRVLVGEAVTTTDDAGDFEVPATVGPRDVSLVLPDQSLAYVYVGLTDQQHSFRLSARSASPSAEDHTANVTVKFPDKDSDSVVSVYGLTFIDNVTRSNFVTKNPSQLTAQERTTEARWRGLPTVKARLDAFQIVVDPVSKVIQHYVGHDSAELSITTGVPASIAVDWKPPTFGEAKVSVTSKLGSPDIALYNTGVGIRFAGGTSTCRLGAGALEGSELTFVVPDIVGATFVVSSDGGDSALSYATASIPGLVAGAKGDILELPSSPHLVSPGVGGTFGIGTKLQWTSAGEEATLTELNPLELAPGRMTYLVATAGETAVIPDLSRLGVTLSPGLKYTWNVYRNSQTPTVEDMTTGFTVLASSTEPSFFAGSAGWEIFSK